MTLHKPQMLLIGAALAAAAATLFIPVAAHATDIEETSTVTVRFGDLDLDSQNGAHHLYLRLKLAAQSVCGDEHDAIDLRDRGDIERCQQTAIEHAVERVDRPMLTALYDRRYPREPAAVSASLSSPSRG
jgi:UrcA family protein